MDDNIRIFVQPNPCCDAIDLFIKTSGGWIRSFECTEVPVGEITPVAMQLRNNQAQDFMDKLWAAGLRPTEGKGSAGALAATERHLQDMRNLVFKTPST